MAEKDFSAVTVAVRKNKVKLLASAVLISICLFLFQVFSSGFGRFMPAIHPDWSSHASTTRFAFLGKDFDSEAARIALDEFAFFPRLAYEASAWVAKIFGISDIQGLTLITHLSIILACVFLALRLCAVFSERQVSTTTKLLIVAGLYISANYLCFGFRNLVVSNSFISQAASLAVAQVFLYFSLHKPSLYRHLAIMFSAALILSQTHMVGFVWCSGTLIVMSLGMPNLNLIKRVGLALAGSVIAAAFLLTSDGLMKTLKIAGTGGEIAAFGGGNIAGSKWFVTVPAVVYCAAFIMFIRCYVQKRLTVQQALWYGAGFLSLAPLIFASAYTAMMKGGSWYPVAKWTYTFLPEMFIFLALLCSKTKINSVNSSKAAIFGLVVLIAAQLPLMSPRVDLESAILAEKGAKSVQGERVYPSLVVDHPAINYFIARAVLDIPYDADTWRWMGRGGQSDTYLSAKDFESVIPVIPAERRVKFRNDKKNRSIAQRMIDHEWWPIEKDFVWAATSPADISFIASQPPKRITMRIVPNLPKGVSDRSFEVYMNGVRLDDLQADRMDWNMPVEYSAEVPSQALREDGNVNLQFKWDRLLQDDPGLALLSIKYF